MGVAFVLESFTVNDNPTAEPSAIDESMGLYGPLSGQIVSAIKEGCRRAFQAQPQRIMAAMYKCDVQVKSEALGKLFASLFKRHGKVMGEAMIEGT